MQQSQHAESRKTFDAEIVKQKARGHWLDILTAQAPDLAPAVSDPGKRVPCPVHGGRDGFRLFKNAAESGGGICNTCGPFDNGISLLQWCNGLSFDEAVEVVAKQLKLEPSQKI